MIKIAPGMSRDITLMMFAVFQTTNEINKLAQFKFQLEITTETHIISLPVEAQIASSTEFRNMFMGNLEAGKAKNVRIMSVRPGSTKEVLTKSNMEINDN